MIFINLKRLLTLGGLLNGVQIIYESFQRAIQWNGFINQKSKKKTHQNLQDYAFIYP
jgi:hypothetical protein